MSNISPIFEEINSLLEELKSTQGTNLMISKISKLSHESKIFFKESVRLSIDPYSNFYK